MRDIRRLEPGRGEPRQRLELECEVVRRLEPLLRVLLDAVTDDALERRRELWLVTERSGGSSLRIADIVSAAESPRNARRPESIS